MAERILRRMLRCHAERTLVSRSCAASELPASSLSSAALRPRLCRCHFIVLKDWLMRTKTI